MKTKHVRYKIEWANGEIETVKVPAFIMPSIVKKSLPYSEVQMFIDKGYHTYVNDQRLDGPAMVTLADDGSLTASVAKVFKHIEQVAKYENLKD